MKKLKGPTTLRHSRESGNLLRRFRKKNRADIVDDRVRIPAFAGMTSVCMDGSHHDGRSAERIGATKDNNSLITLRHSRESGNPGAGRPQYRRGYSYGNAANGFPLSRE